MRTAEEWGRVAVSLPGWRVLRGIRWRGENGAPMGSEWQPWPDPDDPATAGCLLVMLGRQVSIRQRGHWVAEWRGMAPLAPGMGSVKREVTGRGPTLGRACIAAAEALGRWPGGEG